MRELLYIGCLVLLISCSPKSDEQASEPQETATLAQKVSFEKVLATMKEDLADEGYDLKVDFPILLISPEEAGYGSSAGVCYMKNGKVDRILIKPELFSTLSATNPFEPPGYWVLLHELGHCLFKRDHDDEVLSSVHGDLLLNFDNKLGQKKPYRFPHISVSVMNAKSHNFIAGNLRKYFIRELIGRERARSLDDFKKYVDLSIVPKNP